MTKSTLGPGSAISSAAAITNVTQCESGTMRRC